MARRRRNGRAFEWVRTSGNLVSNDVTDLLAGGEARMGGQSFTTDATVTTVRGYLYPVAGGGNTGILQGRVGFRVGNRSTADADVNGLPFGEFPVGEGTELSWMGFYPWLINLFGDRQETDATAMVGSPFAVDISSQRIISARAETLLLCHADLNNSLGSTVYYDLSIGLKRA